MSYHSQHDAHGGVGSVDVPHDLRLDHAALLWKVNQHNVINLEALHVVLHRHKTSVNRAWWQDPVPPVATTGAFGPIRLEPEISSSSRYAVSHIARDWNGSTKGGTR